MVKVPAYFEIHKATEADVASKLSKTGETHIIDYRDWSKTQRKSPVKKIPIEFCLFRPDNGRIMTEVQTYEASKGPLENRHDKKLQAIISNFLSNKDKEKNSELKANLKKDGQLEPAIITADGLLINGNRRKWALEALYKEEPSEDYKYLKVVVLPGTDNSSERPTVRDIALLENRLQFQKMGKSEYTAMDKALKLLQNEKQGIPLEEMLRDDPKFSDKNDKDFRKAVSKFRVDQLEPTELMSQWLVSNKVNGDFKRVEKKWTAFQELNTKIISKLDDPKILATYKIKEDDVGLIKNAAFNILKMRDHSEIEVRTHKLMNDIFKWVDVDKKEFLKIGKIEDTHENIEDPDERFKKWNDEHNDNILNSLKKLRSLAEQKKDQEDPISKMQLILKHLTDEDLGYEQVKIISPKDWSEANDLAKAIDNESTKLRKMFYYIEKEQKENLQNLLKKHNN